MLTYAPHLKRLARRLRSGMTDAEQRLWYRIRRKQIEGVQCYRQKPIGAYIVDFYLPAARLVIEVDGSQHLTEEGMARDAVRAAFLESVGLKVIRFDDRQVFLEMDAVLEVIWRELSYRR
ncbi:MAG: endonuclease domain-containing protein [Pseudoxanthomonas sp.]